MEILNVLMVPLFQVLFWIIAALIAFLTYRQAKKTIFSGSRNEVFKLQIEEIKKLLDFLGKRESFDYDTDDKVQRISLINIFNFFINNFEEISLSSTEKLNMHIELKKNPSDKFSYIIPEGELVLFTADKSRIVLNKQYAIYMNKLDSEVAINQYLKNIFIPDSIKYKLKKFLDYEKSKEQFLLDYLDRTVFVHERIESEAFEYAVEVYHDFYTAYSKNFNPALNEVDNVLNEIKQYLKVDELIG